MRRVLAETAGGLPRTFWYLWAGTLVNRSARSLLGVAVAHLVSGPARERRAAQLSRPAGTAPTAAGDAIPTNVTAPTAGLEVAPSPNGIRTPPVPDATRPAVSPHQAGNVVIKVVAGPDQPQR